MKIPVATLSLFCVTGIATALQFGIPELLPALRRTPTAFEQHQWWRLVTPLFVHADGWRQIAFNFPALLVLGWVVERLYGSSRWLVVYFLSGFIGELAGYAWQPSGAGASVAIAGLLGAVAAWLLLDVRVAQARVGAFVILGGAVALIFSRDPHGPPILAGALLASIMRRNTAATDS